MDDSEGCDGQADVKSANFARHPFGGVLIKKRNTVLSHVVP